MGCAHLLALLCGLRLRRAHSVEESHHAIGCNLFQRPLKYWVIRCLIARHARDVQALSGRSLWSEWLVRLIDECLLRTCKCVALSLLSLCLCNGALRRAPSREDGYSICRQFRI